MAKTSKVVRNEQRIKAVNRDWDKRAALRAASKNMNLSLEERMEARAALSLMPRNAAHVRIRNRCKITGRPRGYSNRLGISRNMVRDLAHAGFLPGLTKSSW